MYVKIDMCKMEPGMSPSGLHSAFSSSRISCLSVWHNLTSYPSHHQRLSLSTSWPMLSFLIIWVIAKGC